MLPYLPYTPLLANEPDVAGQLEPTENSMAQQDHLNALKADFESGRFPLKPSREALETMHRATAELIETGQAQRARKAGDAAPEFTLPDPNGDPVSSRELLAK